MVCVLQPSDGMNSRSSRLRLNLGMAPWGALAPPPFPSPPPYTPPL